MRATPKVVVGMNAANRGYNALDAYFKDKGTWPAYEVMCNLHCYIDEQAEGVQDTEVGLAFAYDALTQIVGEEEARRFWSRRSKW